jgi:hypothetical protein
VAQTAEQILDQLQDPDFDGTQVAVVEHPVDRRLVAASGAAVFLAKGPAIKVRAASTGTSLLVLPFDWSHCLTATGAGFVDLVPVNLAQTGLLIEGDAEVEIRYRFGLFSGTECRAEDRARATALGLDEASAGRLFSGKPPPADQ